jgi:enoyl-CoA hydratase/carnithine racemase
MLGSERERTVPVRLPTAGTEQVRLERDGSTARVTLNRPDRYNALSLELMRELRAVLADLEHDAGTLVIVLAGAGRGFSAGHDLSEMIDRDEAFYSELFAECTRLMQSVRALPQPVIARVHGVATAAGCQLVAACDLAVADSGARFGTPGVRIGLFCSTPMVPLSRAIGRKRALQMLLTGDLIDAATARDWGLLNDVVAPDALDAAVDALAARIVEASPRVVALGKRAFYAQVDRDEADAYALSAPVMADNAASPDAQEGMSAFLAKRPPVWPTP